MSPIRMSAKIKKLYPEWSEERINKLIYHVVHNHPDVDKILDIKKSGDSIDFISVHCDIEIEQLFKEIAKNIIDKNLVIGEDPLKCARSARIKLMRIIQEAVLELTEEV